MAVTEQTGPSPKRSFGRRMLRTDAQSVAYFGDPFRPLEPECKVVQFEQSLTPEQLRAAGKLVAGRPDIELYVYGRATSDLDFLRYFPTIRDLHIALWELEDISGFDAVMPQLVRLNFGRTKKKFSLCFLRAGKQLDRLFLVGHKKDIDVVGTLDQLDELGLSGITLNDLSILLPLARLRIFSLFLGSTTNLGLLPQIGVLEELWLMRITGLSDLDVLRDVRTLTKLRLDWMRNVTQLPSFAPLIRLTDIRLDTMKGLQSLEAVAAAPALKRLSIADMPQLRPDDFACLQGHPQLEELWAFPGRNTVNAAVRAMFPGVARYEGRAK
jgi:hypothetical protein